ncbi:MAG: sulfite exporter TauE/SafE family protein [Leptospiraceae bacterium]|nr:MAG: sulfite exporter TauE/SafE family protein [Leptospiraceae bacterium]
MTLLFEIFVIFFSVFLIATISASLGIGGGLFTVPLLLYLGKYHLIPEQALGHIAIANSLLVAFILSISASYVNIKTKQVDIQLSLNFLAGSIPGAVTGVYISRYLKTKELTLLFGSFVLLIGIISLIRSFRNSQQNSYDEDSIKNTLQLITKLKFIFLILIGFLTGLISSLTGVGGGIIMVPLFALILKSEPFQKSIATSTFSMFIITFFSSVLYSLQHKANIPEPSIGYYYLPFTIPLILGAIPGGYFGATLKGKVPEKNLRRALAILQIIIGIKVLFW